MQGGEKMQGAEGLKEEQNKVCVNAEQEEVIKKKQKVECEKEARLFLQ